MKKFTKLLGIVLIIALVMSMGAMAFAANDGSITIDNAVAGEIYKVYKVFDLTYNGTDTDPVIDKPTTTPAVPASYTTEGKFTGAVSYTYTKTGDNDQLFAALNGAGSPFTLTATSTANVYSVKLTDDTTSGAAIGTFFKGIEDKLGNPTTTLDFTTGYKAEGLPYGYYYITSSLGSTVTVDSTLKDVKVIDKNTITTQDKTVQEDSIATGENQAGDGVTGYGDKDDVDVGDTVYYKSTVTIGAHSKTVAFHDTMTNSLTLTPTSIKVMDGTTDLTKEKYPSGGTNNMATVITEGSDLPTGETFVVKFDDAWTQSLTAAKTVTITYEAVLNENAVIGKPTGNNAEQYGAGNDNKSKVTFGNAQGTTEDWTRTYTWKVDIFKYTQSGTGSDATKTPLAGAKFILYNSDKSKVATWESAQGGLFKGWVTSVKNATTGAEEAVSTNPYVLVTTQTGKLELKGLDADTYKLVETEAPAGYNKLAEDVTVLVESNTNPADSQGNDNTHQADGSVSIKQKNIVVKEVGILNQAGTELPSTGGIGTTIFYVVGSILVVAAGVLLITKKRMGRE